MIDKDGKKQWNYFCKGTVRCMKTFHLLDSILTEFFIASLLKNANIWHTSHLFCMSFNMHSFFILLQNLPNDFMN